MLWISIPCWMKQFFVCFTAYYNDIVVGAVCCRIDKLENARRLYIMTLGCLARYRRLEIGKHLTKTLLFLNISLRWCFWYVYFTIEKLFHSEGGFPLLLLVIPYKRGRENDHVGIRSFDNLAFQWANFSIPFSMGFSMGSEKSWI